MISLNKKAQDANPTSAFRVFATGLSSMLACAVGGLLAVCVLEVRELVKLLGIEGKDGGAAESEKRDAAEAPDGVLACCDEEADE